MPPHRETAQTAESENGQALTFYSLTTAAPAVERCVEMVTAGGATGSSTAPRFLGIAPSDPQGGGGGGTMGREVDPARERLTARPELREPALCSSRVGEML